MLNAWELGKSVDFGFSTTGKINYLSTESIRAQRVKVPMYRLGVGRGLDGAELAAPKLATQHISHSHARLWSTLRTSKQDGRRSVNLDLNRHG